MSIKDAKQVANQFHAGCSSIAWKTKDGKHIWGRNYDYNMIAPSSVIVVPRGQKYYTAGSSFDHNLVDQDIVNAKYAAIGVGTTSMEVTPLLYEGVNEKGLMGGQLFYAGFAAFPDKVHEGTHELNPGYVVSHVLFQCTTVDEVIDLLTKKDTVINQKLVGSLPTVHWIFTDRSGESVILEPDHQQITVYRHTAGVIND